MTSGGDDRQVRTLINPVHLADLTAFVDWVVLIDTLLFDLHVSINELFGDFNGIYDRLRSS
jgi:hypothetical protein